MKRGHVEFVSMRRTRQTASYRAPQAQAEAQAARLPDRHLLDEKPFMPTDRKLQRRVNEYGDTERQCLGCGDWLPENVEFFKRHAAHPGGLNRRCKACGSQSSERKRADAANLRAQRYNLPGTLTEDDITGLWARQKGKCHWCSCALGTFDKAGWHIDHRVPLSRGGTNEARNIVLACDVCNQAKSTKLPEDFQVNPVG